jgi:hypothetical protein
MLVHVDPRGHRDRRGTVQAMSAPLRIGPDGDVTIERTGDRTTICLAEQRPPVEARIEGHELRGGYTELGGWGITEALRRGATVVLADGVANGALLAGIAAWRYGWDRTDWDELGSAVIAGRILARSGFRATVTMHPDATFTVDPATVDGITAHVLAGLGGPDLVEPDATVRLCSVRLVPDGDRIHVHSVRGLPAPADAVVELDEPGGWQASATFAVTGLDPEATATKIWDAAGGTVEVRFTRRERPEPTTWADTLAELRATATGPDAASAEQTIADAVAAIVAARVPGVTPVSARPHLARPVSTRRVRLVSTADVPYTVVVGRDRITVPPAPTRPPPLARRVPEGTVPQAPTPPVTTPRVAPSVSTHPETISVLREDLARRRLSAGPADDDSVHWDSVPASRAALGRLAEACSGACHPSGAQRTGRSSGSRVSVAVWVPSADAYDWMHWHLTVERFRAMLPAQANATVERIDLPNLQALAFVIDGAAPNGHTSGNIDDVPADLLGEYIRAQAVNLPDELYPSSALRTSAT